MKNHQKGGSLKVDHNSCLEYFLQHFEACSRVSFFHLNNWDNEGDSALSRKLSKFMLTKVTKIQS